MTMLQPMHKSQSQQGAVLLVSLVFLLLFTVIGLATIRSTNLQTTMAGNIQNSMSAFEAAEAALRVGEKTVARYSRAPTRVDFNPGNKDVWKLGVNDWATKQSAQWWQANTKQYDTNLKGIISEPYFALESTSLIRDGLGTGHGYGAPSGRYIYRITSRATGKTDKTVVMLQSTYARRYK